MSMGPREMAVLRTIDGPMTERDEIRLRWARITDQFNLASHNLFMACRSSSDAIQRFGESLRAAAHDATEHEP